MTLSHLPACPLLSPATALDEAQGGRGGVVVVLELAWPRPTPASRTPPVPPQAASVVRPFFKNETSLFVNSVDASE